MSDKKDGLSEILVMSFRKLFENIESPYVYMPLALCVLFIVAFPLTQFQLFLYFAIILAIIALVADYIGRMKNQKTPPVPDSEAPNYRDDIVKFSSAVQWQAVNLIGKGKLSSARKLIDKNLQTINDALKSFPNDAELYSLKGYTLKDVYQSSKGMLSTQQRQSYLQLGYDAFKRALTIDPDNAGAHNGMGNILLFQGQFDQALKEHEIALEITKRTPALQGYESTIQHDMNLVKRVKSGEISFERF